MAKNPVNIKKGKITQKSHFGAGDLLVNFFLSFEESEANEKKVYVVGRSGFFVSDIYQTTQKSFELEKPCLLGFSCVFLEIKSKVRIKIKKCKGLKNKIALIFLITFLFSSQCQFDEVFKMKSKFRTFS